MGAVPPSPTMTVEVAAELIGISRSGMYELIESGRSPVKTIRVGRRLLVLSASVRDFLGLPEPVTSGDIGRENRSSEGATTSLTCGVVKCGNCGSAVHLAAVVPGTSDAA